MARLVEILRLDPKCQWLPHFEQCLEETRQLIAGGFSQDHLNDLSSSLMHVYGGMGSFNDYGPYIDDTASGTFSPIPGTEDFGEVSERVHEAALALRVLGHAL